MPSNYSWAVLGISGGDPSFRDDDGSAEPGVEVALGAFAAGQGTERDVLRALASSRLLVPVVAVLPGATDPGQPDQGEKASEMALPMLIGLDGRRAIPAFTSQDSMRRWQADARPVPAAARQVWQAATEDSCAVVIDVAGPVPLAVEGARLAALARGEAVPAPYADPDVHEVVSDVLADELAIAAFELRPGDAERDLVISLTLAPGGAGYDVAGLATDVGNAVISRLGGRLRRGVAIWLGSSQPAG
jgi:SseB protein N-terminal domain